MRKVTFKKELVDNNIELSVHHLKQFFKFGHGSSSLKTKAVHDVSFDIKKGECFGLVGESGCGKTTTGRSLIRLYNITSGSIYFQGHRISAGKRWNEKEIKWSRIKGHNKIKALQEEEKDELFFSAIPHGDAEEIKSLREEAQKLSKEQETIIENYHDLSHALEDIDDLEIYKKEKTDLNAKYKKELGENKEKLNEVNSKLKAKRKEVFKSYNPKKRSDFIKLRKEYLKELDKVLVYKRKVMVDRDGKPAVVFDENGIDISNKPFNFDRFIDDGLSKESELQHQKVLTAYLMDDPELDLVKNNFEQTGKDLNGFKQEYEDIREKYAERIKEIKNSIKRTRRTQKEKIKQINYDNKHVDKKLMSKMQMIFQDPVDSLDPRMTVEDIIQEGLRIQGQRNKFANSKKVADVLEKVGLIPEYASRYPHEFSGGQRQRIGIARALVMNPEFLICDEPISALDVSIRAQIINLLNDLKEEMGLTIMFIAHDLSVVKYFCDRIAVMYFGEMVELASSDELFRHPLHPYAKALLSAIPKPDPLTEKTRKRIVYDPHKEHDYSKEKPTLQEILPGHWILANNEEMKKYRKEIIELDEERE